MATPGEGVQDLVHLYATVTGDAATVHDRGPRSADDGTQHHLIDQIPRAASEGNGL
ncbi:hypothetical protein [Streptomyces sp. NPDC090057]|uniref:hypothetical protein n=1 Tax=Streptomyces sp. NPDC090057 TaxID=3365935 RepID=UPI003827AF4B